MEHSLDTEILVNVGPVDSFTIADDLKLVPLGRCRLTQPPRPRQWNTHDTAVNEVEGDQFFRHRNFFDPSI
jgi:hypothetical protein